MITAHIYMRFRHTSLITLLCLSQSLLSIASENSSLTRISDDELIEKFNNVVKSINSWNYKAEMLDRMVSDVKYRSAYYRNCWIKRDDQDGVYGCQWRIEELKDSLDLVYTGGFINKVYHPTKYVRECDPLDDGTHVVNAKRLSIPNVLIKGIDKQGLLKSGSKIEVIHDTSSKDIAQIKITQPSSTCEHSSYSIWINTTSMMPFATEDLHVCEGLIQSLKMNIQILRINVEGIESEIDINNRIKNYSYYPFTPTEDIESTILNTQPLENGATPPDFSLNDLDGNVVSLKGLKGSPVLLDFYYMSCLPCIKSLPHIQILHEKFRKEGLLVYGVNALDNRNERRDDIKPFLERNKVTYPTLLADRSLEKQYKVVGHPTYVLVGKNGKVAFASFGFGEGMPNILEEAIQAELDF